MGAGELLFANGSRLAGELSSETLMVSTGSGLVEIASDDVAALSREEIQLRDGRVVRGTLVGGQIKAQTTLGEIAVKVDELQSYRAGAPSVASPDPRLARRGRGLGPSRAGVLADGFEHRGRRDLVRLAHDVGLPGRRADGAARATSSPSA